MTAASSSSVTPNFELLAPTARPRMVSGRTDGLSRMSASRRRSSGARPVRRAVPTAAASAAASSADSIATQRNGRAGRGEPHRTAKVSGRLADALEGDGLHREPGPARQRELAARHGIGTEAALRQLRDQPRQAIGLERIEADPRIGSCAELVGIGAQLGQVVDIGRRAPPAGDRSGCGGQAGRSELQDGPLSRG